VIDANSDTLRKQIPGFTNSTFR